VQLWTVFLLNEAQTFRMDSEKNRMNIESDAYQANREDENIEGILESAVILNWVDLMGAGERGLFHIEYAFALGGTLDCVQVWSSRKRGYWLLTCTYSMSATQSHGAGVHFANDFASASLAYILETVMQNQNLFTSPKNMADKGCFRLQRPRRTRAKRQRFRLTTPSTA
jgi:hypothetical protein